ncbi:hypothetical protein [Burkholderia plantarii]|uniref:hypothetical protein n=1 Tax=Burkholderia plantarii TaxID=41899 RepID=UPI000AC71462|nr:hypothetical protein [Burkholderia plantarii]GLZ19471.1 hypothetical protein Bpla01_30010 [Burkholderia plantarii]
MSENTSVTLRAADELDADIRAFRYVSAIFDAISHHLTAGTPDPSNLISLCGAGHEIAVLYGKRAVEASWQVRHALAAAEATDCPDQQLRQSNQEPAPDRARSARH